jgi:hypothetical protein
MTEGQQHAGAGFLRGFRRQHEDTGTDHRADTQHRQLEGAKRSMKSLFLGRRENGVERLDAVKKHAGSLCGGDFAHFCDARSLTAWP